MNPVYRTVMYHEYFLASDPEMDQLVGLTFALRLNANNNTPVFS